MSKEVIDGILEYCYGGMPVIRGYASHKTLINHSTPHPAYQRQIDDAHVEELKEFLDSPSTFKFMPEVILSYDCSGLIQAPGDWTQPELSTPIQYLYDGVEKSGGRVQLVDPRTGLKIMRYKSNSGDYRPIRLDVSKQRLLTMQPLFQRIDGNHRLEAMRQAEMDDFEIPFCIILLANDGEQSDTVKSQIVMEIFHNINAKVKPLTPIEQYRGFFHLFTVSELSRFGKEHSLAKAYLEKYQRIRFSNLSSFFAEPDDMVLFCAKFLLDRSIDITEDDLWEVFNELEHTYFQECREIRNCKNRYALIPYVYFCVIGDKKRNAMLTSYNSWFIKNKLYDVANFDAASFIDVFNSIYELRKKKIFIAMPFKDELEFVYTSIRDVVKKINHDNSLDLPLPVRIDKQIVGFSYDIVNEILDNIENAGLLIADLTTQNANVYYEVGFAQGLLRAKLGNTVQVLYLISNPKNPEKPYEEAKFDVEHYKLIGYSNDGNGVQKLKDDLEKELKEFYSI